jgi:hypothetical protein
MAGLFVSPKDKTLHLYTPNRVRKVVNFLESGYIRIRWKAYLISSLINSLARPIRARVSSIRKSGYRFFLIKRLSFLKLIQKRRNPSGFLIKKAGAVNRIWFGLIKSLSRFFIKYYLTTSSSSVDIRYNGWNFKSKIKTPISSLIWWLYSLWGNNLLDLVFKTISRYSWYFTGSLINLSFFRNSSRARFPVYIIFYIIPASLHTLIYWASLYFFIGSRIASRIYISSRSRSISYKKVVNIL